MTRLTRIRHILNSAVVTLAVFLLAVMTVSLFASIIIRELTLFRGSIIWIEELSRYSLLWITFLGAAAVLHRAEHISVDFFVQLLPRQAQRAITFLVRLCMFAFLILLLGNGIGLVRRTLGHATPILGITVGYVYAIIPATAAIMAFYVLCFLCEDWHRHSGKASEDRGGALS